jgi:hypothetical protein
MTLWIIFPWKLETKAKALISISQPITSKCLIDQKIKNLSWLEKQYNSQFNFSTKIRYKIINKPSFIK